MRVTSSQAPVRRQLPTNFSLRAKSQEPSSVNLGSKGFKKGFGSHNRPKTGRVIIHMTLMDMRTYRDFTTLPRDPLCPALLMALGMRVSESSSNDTRIQCLI